MYNVNLILYMYILYIYIHTYIYIYIYVVYIYILYIYIYMYVYFQVLRFSCKPSFTMLCPSLKEGLFFQKELPKKLFMGKSLRENLWGGVHDQRDSCSDGIMEELLIRPYQVRGSKMHFTIICKSIKGKSFPQPCWDIHLKNKP